MTPPLVPQGWGSREFYARLQRALRLDDEDAEIGLADVPRDVRRIRPELPHFAGFPIQCFLLAVRVDALERSVDAHAADAVRSRAIWRFGSDGDAALIQASCVVHEQPLDVRLHRVG